MSSQRTLTRTALVVGGLVLLTAAVLVSLPFIGALAFIARAVAVLAIPAFIVAVLLSPRFRAWLNEVPEGDTMNAKGLILPSRLMFHPKHGWARADGLNRVSVGADDLMQRVLGPVRKITLPEVGVDVRQGSPSSR